MIEKDFLIKNFAKIERIARKLFCIKGTIERDVNSLGQNLWMVFDDPKDHDCKLSASVLLYDAKYFLRVLEMT